MRVLCLQPHPDDVIISCGGTLLLHQQQGDEVLVFSFTKGERAGRNRDKELEGMVTELEGVYTWNQKWASGDYPFPDGEIPATAPEKFREIDKRIKEYNPDVVYVPYPQDTHPDHANAAQHGLALTRNCRRVLLYENFSAQAFDGTVFVDISHVWHRKENLLRQFKGHPIPIDVVEAMARFRAVQGRLQEAQAFAEAFAPVRFAPVRYVLSL